MPLRRDPTDRPNGPETCSRRAGVLMLALFVAMATLVSWRTDEALAHGDEVEQTQCPVMVGNPINPDLYTVHQGKKVYFCCSSCKSAFEANPEEYLHRLPQFASIAGVTAAGDDSHGHESVSRWLAKLIVPTGIVTLSLVAVTVLLAVLRRVKRFKARVVMRVHKVTGVSALITGILHAALIVFFH